MSWERFTSGMSVSGGPVRRDINMLILTIFLPPLMILSLWGVGKHMCMSFCLTLLGSYTRALHAVGITDREDKVCAIRRKLLT
jgi:uncharacterized membrane protein YqaE (UPF0057 family)